MVQVLCRRLRRARHVFRAEGVGPLVGRVLARVRMAVGLPDRDLRDFLARKVTADDAFDSELGTDTGGIQRMSSLTLVGPNGQYGIDHIASAPVDFEQAIRSINIPLETATFVDLGAGKGRALLMAARHPFRRVLGVEFARELYDTALQNIARAGADSRVSVIHGDATEVELPGGPIVVFMFNPFDAPVVRRVAQNAMTSYRREPRPMRILYLNPRCGDVVLECGWSVARGGRGHVLYAPTEESSVDLPTGLGAYQSALQLHGRSPSV